MEVQAFISNLATLPLNIGVLDRLSRSVDMLDDAAFVRPLIQCLADQLWTMVCDDHGWLSALSQHRGEQPGYIRTVMEVPTCINTHALVKSSTTFRTRPRLT